MLNTWGILKKQGSIYKIKNYLQEIYFHKGWIHGVCALKDDRKQL